MIITTIRTSLGRRKSFVILSRAVSQTSEEAPWSLAENEQKLRSFAQAVAGAAVGPVLTLAL